MGFHHSSPGLRRAATVCLVALSIAGCGIRVGDPPAPVPTPDAAEEHRQEVAVAIGRVAQAVQRAEDSGDQAPRGLAEAASTYLADLGGVWVPPPRDEDPSPTSPVVTDAADDLEGTVRASVEELAGLLPSAPPEQREGTTSMWLTLRSAQAALSGEPGPECSLPCGPGVIPPAQLEDPAPGAVELVGIYDALGYLEEVRAARAGDEDRDEIAEGARTLRRFAEDLAGPQSGTGSDTRQSAYDLDPTDLRASAHTYLEAATTQWLIRAARAPSGEQRSALEDLWYTYAISRPGPDIELWPGL